MSMTSGGRNMGGRSFGGTYFHPSLDDAAELSEIRR